MIEGYEWLGHHYKQDARTTSNGYRLHVVHDLRVMHLRHLYETNSQRWKNFARSDGRRYNPTGTITLMSTFHPIGVPSAKTYSERPPQSPKFCPPGPRGSPLAKLKSTDVFCPRFGTLVANDGCVRSSELGRNLYARKEFSLVTG